MEIYKTLDNCIEINNLTQRASNVCTQFIDHLYCMVYTLYYAYYLLYFTLKYYYLICGVKQLYIKNNCNFFEHLQLGRCRFVGEFEKINRIGEGTYGIVCKYNI